MVNMQFFRNDNRVVLIDPDAKLYRTFPLGYLLFSFAYDADIEIPGNNTKHPYWGLPDVQTANSFSAKMCQEMFQKILSSRLQLDSPFTIESFEASMVEYGLAIPSHFIGNASGSICDIYQCIELPGYMSPIVEQLCVAELYEIVKRGLIIKLCQNCNRPFIPKRIDEKYCIRKSTKYSNMNCKQEAKYKQQLEREHKDQCSKLYHSINTMLAKRAKDAPDNKLAQAQQTLYTFRSEADEWKQKIKTGAANETDFIDWLNSFKARKKK